jgi:ABC-2 type transport system ATP-binding protein
MNEVVIHVSDFCKHYGDVTAVDGVNFDVYRGEIFGLLGPNGAGKTTTLESLEGLRVPDGGSLHVMGVDPVHQAQKLRNLIGVQLQTSGMPDKIRVDEAITLFCAYHGIAPRFDLLDRLGLSEKKSAQYQQLSAGLQRRLSLAIAIAHDPPVLFLDEPTAGLDVPSRVELHKLIRELQTEGATIVLATHDMAEVEEITDRVAILLRGKIAATGSPLELTATGSGLTKVSVRTKGSSLSDPKVSFRGVCKRVFREDYSIYYSTDVGPTVAAIIAHIEAREDTLIDLRVERPSLEDRFLEIVAEGNSQ